MTIIMVISTRDVDKIHPFNGMTDREVIALTEKAIEIVDTAALKR